nr:phosphoenolpyruvate/phosphate translocator 2, chloroplastic-like [Malus domestica]
MQSTTLALSPSTSFLKPPCRNSIPKAFQLLPSTYDHLTARAASVPESADEASKQSGLVKTLQLGYMYLLNIYFNIYNKQKLEFEGQSLFIGSESLSISSNGHSVSVWLRDCDVILMWALNLYPRPNLTRSQQFYRWLWHTVGNLLTNISLGKIAVYFTHTIKAMEPFFTVVFSALLLAEVEWHWHPSLRPFKWIGFGSAMASNVTNQSRNVLSKKFMESLDNINLFSVITIISFILLVPSAILLEGVKFTTPYLHSAVSYMILQMVSPVTHAVGNCVKRLVVIVSSVIFFQTPVSPMNALGTAFARSRRNVLVFKSQETQTKAQLVMHEL